MTPSTTPRRPPRLPALLPAALPALLPAALPALLALLAACGGGASGEDTDAAALPTAQERVDGAAVRMAQVSALGFSLTHETGVTTLFPGVLMDAAEGESESADMATMLIDARLAVSGAYVGIAVTVNGDDATMTEPLTGAKLPLSAEALPFRLQDLPRTLGAIIGAIESPLYTDAGDVDGVPSRGIAGEVTGADLAKLVPRAVPEYRQKIEVWVGDDDLVRRVRIAGRIVEEDGGRVVRLLTLRDFRTAPSGTVAS